MVIQGGGNIADFAVVTSHDKAISFNLRSLPWYPFDVKTLGRRLLDGAAALSLMACALALVLGVRSFWRADVFVMEWERKWEITSNLGILEFSVLTQYPDKALLPHKWVPTGPRQAVSPILRFEHYASSPQPYIRAFWYRILSGHQGEYTTYNSTLVSNSPVLTGVERIGPLWGVPAWAVVLIAAVLPCIWMMQTRKRRSAKMRLSQSFCIHCGYDLRATPHRCPECGENVALG
jgi:hypothetical protein